MRKYLPILFALTILASCVDDKPVPEPENPVPATPTGLVLHGATENGLTFQWDAMQYAASYAWELQQAGAKLQEGTTKNALARGTETLAQIMLQDVSKQISKESYFIRVAAGTEFYLFVQQVINLDEAKIANTLLNKLEQQKIQGQEKKRSAKDILNSFSRNQP